MWSRPATICSVLLSIASMQLSAQCRKATREETPVGANLFELMETQTVPNIHGKVFLPDGSAGEDVVVEVFRYKGGDNYEDIKKALTQKRTKACVTGENGKFSLTGLRPGKYLLRAGTLPVRGLNEAHIILVLRPGTQEEKKEGLEIKLSVGT